jgi:hypothetical protein
MTQPAPHIALFQASLARATADPEFFDRLNEWHSTVTTCGTQWYPRFVGASDGASSA